MKYQTDLSVRIAGAEFKNPVMPASGAYDYFDANANVFDMKELGAVMVKSVHRLVRPGNPGPRITEVLGGMINAVGIPSKGIEYFMEHDIDRYASLGAPVVLSLSGNAAEHYTQSLEILANDSRIAAVELNLSCPNVGSGLAFASSPESLREVVESARTKTSLPMFVKLAPNVTDIRPCAKMAEACGADAITVSNTFRAMKIDIKKQKPVLGNISGGMSGPAIKPQNMFLVWQAYQTVNIPIIASGGVSCWEDAVEYILAGAAMIQVGCSNFTNPMCMMDVIAGIDQYASAHGYTCLDDFRGLAHR